MAPPLRLGDLGFFRLLVQEMRDTGLGNRLLILTDHAQLPRVNLAFLRALLAERGPQGLYVTFERPYRETARALEKNGVPFGGLKFLDTVSSLTGETVIGGPNVRFVRLPFDLRDALRSMGLVNGGARVDADFVLLDGLHALFAYHTRQEAEELVEDLLRTLGGQTHLLVGLCIDALLHRQLYDLVAPLCDVQVELSGADRPSREPRPAMLAPTP